jgi:DNA uptake protein ComE-like DNA-binding protein
MASITTKGKAWEFRHSLWMLWVFLTFGVLNYVSFFYASYKVKQKKWFIAGIIYSIPFILMMITADTALSEHWISDVSTMSYLIGWISSVVHVFKIRPEYLLRLEAKLSSGYKEKEIENLKKTIAREYSTTSKTNIQHKLKTASKDQVIRELQPEINKNKAVNINHATEEELAMVPGIGVLFAKKVISIREQENGFKSFDHFVEVLEVKPHLAEKIKPYLLFPEKEPVVASTKKSEGRVIDF